MNWIIQRRTAEGEGRVEHVIGGTLQNFTPNRPPSYPPCDAIPTIRHEEGARKEKEQEEGVSCNVQMSCSVTSITEAELHITIEVRKPPESLSLFLFALTT